MHLTASVSEKKKDSIIIAILLIFAGNDATEVFNTFQFPKGNEKKLDKGLEQFERFEGSRDGVVVIALASHLRRFDLGLVAMRGLSRYWSFTRLR